MLYAVELLMSYVECASEFLYFLCCVNSLVLPDGACIRMSAWFPWVFQAVGAEKSKGRKWSWGVCGTDEKRCTKLLLGLR